MIIIELPMPEKDGPRFRDLKSGEVFYFLTNDRRNRGDLCMKLGEKHSYVVLRSGSVFDEIDGTGISPIVIVKGSFHVTGYGE